MAWLGKAGQGVVPRGEARPVRVGPGEDNGQGFRALANKKPPASVSLVSRSEVRELLPGQLAGHSPATT